ncbi:MAG: SpoIIE family protein phosphatase [Bacteroidota bacterium]|nr:SpoIIE family protein phosphatase [Bacteroidota bacterium]
MSYFHIDIFEMQTPKQTETLCGDVIGVRRSEYATTIILSDGLGSGIKANIAANLCVSRILGLINNGATYREAFKTMVSSMNKVWGTKSPFAVFTVAQILNNGKTTVLSYEMPSPILVSKRAARVISDRVYTIEKAIINETDISLELGEGLLLLSDGITQAGLGRGLQNGWESEGVAKYATMLLQDNSIDEDSLIVEINKRAFELWGRRNGDDCSILYAKSRNGIVLNILTGLPRDKSLDQQYVKNFMSNKGFKVVCGGSTAKVVAREMHRTLQVKPSSNPTITPPNYIIDGIDLATEGIITLNQVYNLLDENIYNPIDPDNPVYKIIDLINNADRINIWTGTTKNEGITIEFKQQGILLRNKIIPLIVEKLKMMGKLVVYNEV